MSNVVEVDNVLTKVKTAEAPTVSPIVKNIVNEIFTRLGGREVNPQTLMTIVKYAMEAVEVTKMKGSEQREMVVDIVQKVIIDAPLSDEREKLCLDMIESGVLGQTIDLVVDATKGRLDVNSAVTLAENCCLSFLNSRKKQRKNTKNS